MTVASGEMGMMPAACLPLFMELCRAGTRVTRGDPGLGSITTTLHPLWHEIIILFFFVSTSTQSKLKPNRAKAQTEKKPNIHVTDSLDNHGKSVCSIVGF